MREDNDNLELNKKDEDFIFADEPEIKSVGRRRSRIDNNLKNGINYLCYFYCINILYILLNELLLDNGFY